MKTEDILLDNLNGIQAKYLESVPRFKEWVLEAMEEYKDQAVKEAVDLALQVAAEKATCSDASWNVRPNYTVDTSSIIDCKEEILKQLNIKP